MDKNLTFRRFIGLAVMMVAVSARASPLTWTNGVGNIRVGNNEMGEAVGCTTNTRCHNTSTINIGTGWTEVEVFLMDVHMQTDVSSGDKIGRIYAEASKASYNISTGALVVNLDAEFDTPTTHSMGYQFWYSFIATKASGVVEPVRKVAVTRTCSGTTDTDCSQSGSNANTKTANWIYLGHGVKSLDMHVSSGAFIDFKRITLQVNGSGTLAGTSTSLSFKCELTTDGSVVSEPLDCAVQTVVLSADSSVVTKNSQTDYLYYLPSTLGSLLGNTFSTPTTMSGPLPFLQYFSYERIPAGGAEYGPVFELEFGCPFVNYSAGTLSGNLVGRFTNVLTVPYLQYGTGPTTPPGSEATTCVIDYVK